MFVLEDLARCSILYSLNIRVRDGVWLEEGLEKAL